MAYHSVPAGCSSTRSGSRSRRRQGRARRRTTARCRPADGGREPFRQAILAAQAAAETDCRVLPEVFAFDSTHGVLVVDGAWLVPSFVAGRSTTPTPRSTCSTSLDGVSTALAPRLAGRERQARHVRMDRRIWRYGDGRGSAPRLPGARPAAVRDPRRAGHLRARHSGVRSWDVRTSTSMLILNRWIRAGRCGAAGPGPELELARRWESRRRRWS